MLSIKKLFFYFPAPKLILLSFLINGFFFNVAYAQNTPSVPNQFLIKFKKETNLQQKTNLKNQLSVTVLKTVTSNTELWQLPEHSHRNVNTVIDDLSKQANIEYISPNHILGLSQHTNHVSDPIPSQQWALGMDYINAEEVMATRTESPDVKIAIIDSGIDWTHPDLVENIWQNTEGGTSGFGEDLDGDGRVIEWDAANNIWIFDPDDENGIDDDGNGYIDDFIGWDFINNNNNPFDENGHGTHVAGMIGANGGNGFGVNGMTWNVQMAALKIFGRTNYTGTTATAIEAIGYAEAMGFPISNNSWGLGTADPAISDAITSIHSQLNGHLFVAAAGNEGRSTDERPRYPAAFDLDNIISVTASDRNDNLASFSSFHANDVDIVAPGAEIYSTLPQEQYGFKTGTSMAAAFVTGAAALLMAECSTANVSVIKSKLMNSVDTKHAFTGKCLANGRLNINTALNFEGVSTFTPIVTPASLTVTFVPTDENRPFVWQFGVGTTLGPVTGTVNHTFSRAGRYKVCVDSEEDCGTPTTCEYVVVTHPMTCTGTFTYSDDASNNSQVCARPNHHLVLLNETPNSLETEWFINDVYIPKSTDAEYIHPLAQTVPGDFEVTMLAYRATDTCVVTQSFPIYTSAETLDLGADMTTYESNVTLKANLADMQIYNWYKDNIFLETTTEDMLTTSESGLFRLEATDRCTVTVSDEVRLNLRSSDVYPGDADFNGIVNHLDAFQVYCQEGIGGPARNEAPEVSLLWQAHEIADWGNNSNTRGNGKHKDTNGDGTVNLAGDLEAIRLNYNKNHYSGRYLPYYDYGSALYRRLQPHFVERITDEDSTVLKMDIHLESARPLTTSTSGFMFSIDYRGFGSRAYLDVMDSPLGTKEDLFIFTQQTRGTRLDVIIARKDRQTIDIDLTAQQLSVPIANFIIVDQNILTDDPASTLQVSRLRVFETHLLWGGCTIDESGLSSSAELSITTTLPTGTNRNSNANWIISAETIEADCYATGYAKMNVVGGVAPYTFEWEDGQTGEAVSGLEFGMHQVTVTDATQAQMIGSVEIEGIPKLETQWEIFSNGDDTYDVHLEAIGGAGFYTHSWSDGQQGTIAYNLAEGEYTVFTSGANFCVKTDTIVVGALPLNTDMLAFKAKTIDNKMVQLTWSVANEKDLQYYDIHRSEDGQHFESISKTHAINASTQTQQYAFLDKNVQAGQTYYYKINSHSLDKKEEESPIQSVYLAPKNSEVFIHPTLVDNHFQIVFQEMPSQISPLTIYDSTGRKVQQLNLKNAENQIHLTIDFQNQLPGVYYATLQYNQALKTFKLVKL